MMSSSSSANPSNIGPTTPWENKQTTSEKQMTKKITVGNRVLTITLSGVDNAEFQQIAKSLGSIKNEAFVKLADAYGIGITNSSFSWVTELEGGKIFTKKESDAKTADEEDVRTLLAEDEKDLASRGDSTANDRAKKVQAVRTIHNIFFNTLQTNQTDSKQRSSSASVTARHTESQAYAKQLESQAQGKSSSAAIPPPSSSAASSPTTSTATVTISSTPVSSSLQPNQQPPPTPLSMPSTPPPPNASITVSAPPQYTVRGSDQPTGTPAYDPFSMSIQTPPMPQQSSILPQQQSVTPAPTPQQSTPNVPPPPSRPSAASVSSVTPIISAHSEESAKAESELQRISERNSVLESQVNALQSQLAKNESQFSMLSSISQNERREATEKLTEVQTKLETVQKQQESTQTQMNELQRSQAAVIAEKEKELNIVKDKSEKAEEALKEIEKQLAPAAADSAVAGDKAHEKQPQTVTERVASLQRHVVEAQQAAQQATSAAAAQAKEMQQLQTTLTHAQQELQQAKGRTLAEAEVTEALEESVSSASQKEESTAALKRGKGSAVTPHESGTKEDDARSAEIAELSQYTDALMQELSLKTLSDDKSKKAVPSTTEPEADLKRLVIEKAEAEEKMKMMQSALETELSQLEKLFTKPDGQAPSATQSIVQTPAERLKALDTKIAQSQQAMEKAIEELPTFESDQKHSVDDVSAMVDAIGDVEKTRKKLIKPAFVRSEDTNVEIPEIEVSASTKEDEALKMENEKLSFESAFKEAEITRAEKQNESEAEEDTAILKEIENMLNRGPSTEIVQAADDAEEEAGYQQSVEVTRSTSESDVKNTAQEILRKHESAEIVKEAPSASAYADISTDDEQEKTMEARLRTSAMAGKIESLKTLERDYLQEISDWQSVLDEVSELTDKKVKMQLTPADPQRIQEYVDKLLDGLEPHEAYAIGQAIIEALHVRNPDFQVTTTQAYFVEDDLKRLKAEIADSIKVTVLHFAELTALKKETEPK